MYGNRCASVSVSGFSPGADDDPPAGGAQINRGGRKRWRPCSVELEQGISPTLDFPEAIGVLRQFDVLVVSWDHRFHAGPAFGALQQVRQAELITSSTM